MIVGEIVAKATEFFSEEGVGGGTRELARRSSYSRCYIATFKQGRLDQGGLSYGLSRSAGDLLGRAAPVAGGRFETVARVLRAYTDAIFTRKWLRIYLAGLKRLDINRWYVGMVEQDPDPYVRECR
jgi:hypothetical protein